MKKTLTAVAVLGAFAGSALAADVTLYGVVDLGLQYKNVDASGVDFDSKNSFSLESGQQAGSRFGFKGSEKISDDLTVSFILENGFDADDGQLQAGLLFRRESTVSLSGGWGQFTAGRFGSVNQGVSSWGLAGALSAFGTSWGYAVQTGSFVSTGGLWDNMIGYQTPTFAGLKVYAQYAMGTDDKENESSSDRYYALAATYKNGPLVGYLAVDSRNYESGPGTDVDDSLTVTAGGNWDFGVAKVYLGVQYFQDVQLSSLSGVTKDEGKGVDIATGQHTDGFGVGLSAGIPVGNGTAMVGVAYVDGSESDKADGEFDFTRYAVSAGYSYNLSKRTNLYAVVAYMQDKYEQDDVDDIKLNACNVQIGLRHRF